MPKKEEKEKKPSSNNKKILVIEDDASILQMYQTSFENEGYHVLIADNGEAGLIMAQKEKPNLILLDIMMPKMDGFAVLTQLKEDKKTKSLPIIMLTNLAQDEDRERGKKLGAVDYLVKSNLTPNEINAKIKEYIK